MVGELPGPCCFAGHCSPLPFGWGACWASLTRSFRAPHWQQGPTLDSRVQEVLLQLPAGPASTFKKMELDRSHRGNLVSESAKTRQRSGGEPQQSLEHSPLPHSLS